MDKACLLIAGQNLAALTFVAGIVLFIRRALPREPWRTAWRQLRRRVGAMIALVILALYVLVGLLDSFSWRDAVIGETQQPLRDTSGAVVLSPVERTLLDRICAPLVRNTEKTYSAPLADEQFSREMVQDESGKNRWVSPPLKHPGSHPLGTDKVGNDVLYRALKGVRTGLLIGGLTVAIAIPFALIFGLLAGYLGGWVDAAIQYLYSTLSSIPSVLLISAFVLLWGRGLVQLCIILGVMSWTALCRLVRAESMKLRELEYVQAAEILGVPRARILLRHVLPNLLHLVTISAVLQFSGLILAESILSYIGVGVDVSSGSWGNMISSARLELSRDPPVWWNLLAAFVFYVGLVLSMALLGDATRDALDPRLRER